MKNFTDDLKIHVCHVPSTNWTQTSTSKNIFIEYIIDIDEVSQQYLCSQNINTGKIGEWMIRELLARILADKMERHY